jgi:hypothetical protein
MFDAQALETLKSVSAGRMPEGGFGHRAHLLVAWYLVRTEPFPKACSQMCAALQTLTAALGEPEVYDAELTRAWMLKVASRAEMSGDFDAFMARSPELEERL